MKFLLSVFLKRDFHEMRKKRKSHVFEGKGWAMEKLKEGFSFDVLESDDLLWEVLWGIGFLDSPFDFLVGKVIKIWPKDFVGEFGVGKVETLFDL